MPPPVMTHPDRWRLDQLLAWGEADALAEAALEALVAPGREDKSLVDLLPQWKRRRTRYEFPETNAVGLFPETTGFHTRRNFAIIDKCPVISDPSQCCRTDQNQCPSGTCCCAHPSDSKQLCRQVGTSRSP
ncbi:hypothetical protein Pve01_90030 [Planomonospora venezuelensis]|nr:hypothetical protein Pve01_90030 [Planomonospora venezuelensis]